MLGVRWLTILPLGTPTARGVGVPVPMAQASLFFLVAVMTAIATPVIGPLTFVGLIAPHIVGLLGVRREPVANVLSAITGAALMIVADMLARTIAFPLQLSTGILASLLAGPCLMLLIASGGRAIKLSARERP
jgi:ferric hydroxamate transport system permease protein